jgi:hypothetical protein
MTDFSWFFNQGNSGQQNATIDSTDQQAFTAASRGQLDTLIGLVENGAKVTTTVNGMNALQASCANGTSVH